MKVVIDPGSQLKFKPIKPAIKSELELREGNKDYIYNLTPFVRVSCLQEVAYTEEEKAGKKNNLKDIRNSILTDATRFNGFQFTFDSDFDQAYGEVQKIGKTLDNVDVNIKNPRRVPPPSLDTFTAVVGEDSDFFTNAQLSFTCNSLEQLQFLTPFLFNPGNTIFVEFGHNTGKLKNNISLFDADDAQTLVKSVVVDEDCNTSNDSKFIERMNKRIFDSGGSYDFFYGIVNNMNFSINESLGFDCTVDLIAATQMKLKSPNADDYNNLSIEQRKAIARTLDSKLKTFRDNLEIINYRDEKDIIFSFGDSDTTTYVRFIEILRFLNGDYTQTSDLFNSEGLFRINEGTNQPVVLRDKKNKWYDSVLGDDDRIEVNKANYDIGEPPIVSYSSDVLLFRKEQWNPKVRYDKEFGSYSILYDTTNAPLQRELSNNDFVDGSIWVKDNSFSIKRVDRPGLRLFDIHFNFDLIKPYLMDVGKNLPENKEDLRNVYINFERFENIYKASRGKPLDILKKLKDLINNATNEHWDLILFGDVIKSSNDGTAVVEEEAECEKPVTRFGSVSSFDVEQGDTYQFKATTKGSVFTSIDYGLGLDGLLGDQIYMNALNSSDGSAESQKLNLLLFSNHENNLEIVDKRNREISSQRKNEDKSTDEDNTFEYDAESDEFDVTKNEIAVDMKSKFYAKSLVSNTGNGEISSDFPNQNLAQVFVNNIDEGDDPLNTSLENLRAVRIGGASFLITREDGTQGTSGPSVSHNFVFSSLSNLYQLQDIPLVFEPLKRVIENARAKVNGNNQPKEEKETERDRSFKKGGINPLLESTLDITMPGIGGINPLEYVEVNGIPDVYAERGQFCVMNVAHTITPTNWETQISTRFRPTYEDEG